MNNFNITLVCLVVFMSCQHFTYISPLHLRGGGYIDFGADPVGIGIGITLLSAQYLVNQ